jgi:hypothetical protein
MKRVFSILLICLLLFNWFGYRLLISFIESKDNIRMEMQLDKNNFDESQLISIKIPMRYLPYSTGSSAFERVDGQIEIEGIPYKYVKRRLYNDSLEMLCIPNKTAMKWQNAKNEYFRFANDLQHEKKSPARNSTVKSFSVDNYIQQEPWQLFALHFNNVRAFPDYVAMLGILYSSTAEHPPQFS